MKSSVFTVVMVFTLLIYLQSINFVTRESESKQSDLLINRMDLFDLNELKDVIDPAVKKETFVENQNQLYFLRFVNR